MIVTLASLQLNSPFNKMMQSLHCRQYTSRYNILLLSFFLMPNTIISMLPRAKNSRKKRIKMLYCLDERI